MAAQACVRAGQAARHAWHAADAVTAAAAALGAAQASEAAARFTHNAMEYAFKCANPHALHIDMPVDNKAQGMEKRRAGQQLEILVQVLDGYGECSRDAQSSM